MAGGIHNQGGEDELVENHEINVTPFIDVILVLLIIFMVAAPLATVDINVDLPKSSAQPVERPKDPLFLTLKEDLSLSLGDDGVSRGALQAALDAFTQGDKERRVFLRADKGVNYGELMEVMNLLRSSGYLKIGLVGLESVSGDVPSSSAATSTPTTSMPSASITSGADAPIP